MGFYTQGSISPEGKTFVVSLTGMKKKLLYLFAALSCMTLQAQTPESRHNMELKKYLEIFNDMYLELDNAYVDTLDVGRDIKNAAAYMLEQLDPYTELYTEEDTEDLTQMTTGKYAGIGSVIAFNSKAQRCIIADPYEGMPAAEAGLRPGDVILAQDGVEYGAPEKDKVADYTSHVSKSLRGDAGTEFRLTVQRPGEKDPFTVTLHRRVIALPNVGLSKLLDGSVGYILVNGYTETTGRDVKRAVTELKEQGARGIILDLRDNPGGLLSQAVSVCNMFLPRGKEIVNLRGKGQNESYSTTEEPVDTELPLAVLINFGTASAAEITSGALQDYDRAVIIGQRSYGKGLVQHPRQLSHKAVLKVTSSKYYIPSGRCIQAYSYKDGVPQHLPDSLAKEFRTAAGRVVRDGGGITPDISIPTDSMSAVLAYLDASDQLYEWCSLYRKKHDSVAPAAEFHLTDAEYDDLKAYLKENGFKYETRTKTVFNLLKDVARIDGYADVAGEQIKALEESLAQNYDYDFEHWKPEIRKIAEKRLLGYYYYQRGRHEHAVRDDKTVAEAIRILTSPEDYAKLLHATAK